MAISWSEKYSVGVKIIDDQHKYFIEIMNNLYDAMLVKNSNKEIEEIFKKLVWYAGVHFATEEKYFDKFNYELADEHKAEHRKLSNRVAEFETLYEKNPEKTFEITSELINFLEDWLVDHLANQDKKYMKCFKENGLS